MCCTPSPTSLVAGDFAGLLFEESATKKKLLFSPKKDTNHHKNRDSKYGNLSFWYLTLEQRNSHHVFCFSIPVPFQHFYIANIHVSLTMGKGGNAATITTASNNAALRAERQAKMKQEPKFYWASGDSMEEPHVLR
jgi:hypothetical protein